MFFHDVVYVDSTYLAKRTVSDKILNDRAYEIALYTKYDTYDTYRRGLATIMH